jgi:hypothetical protein
MWDKLSVAGGIVLWLGSPKSTILGIAPQVICIDVSLDTNCATCMANHTILVACLFDHLDQAQTHQDAAS